MAATGCDHDVEFVTDANAVNSRTGLSPPFENFQGSACQHLDDIFIGIENNIECQLDTNHFTGFVQILAYWISRYPSDPGTLSKHNAVIVLDRFRRGTTPCLVYKFEVTIMSILPKMFKKLARDERGVTLVEYGIALTLAIVVGVGALTALGTNVEESVTAAGNIMPD